MTRTEPPLLSLTAGDLMSRDVETLDANLPLRDAALVLIRRAIHGAPVVDDTGTCVGVLSVTDLARWAATRGERPARLPRTCSFQKTLREPGGRETVVCRLEDGVCPFQRLQEMSDGRTVLACIEPHCVPTDWQVVELEALPTGTVRDFMTTAVRTVDPGTPVPELARIMLDQRVHRLIVLDAGRHPIGVVTVDDLLQVLAHPELNTAEDHE
jgi:CBS domain-containing protein